MYVDRIKYLNIVSETCFIPKDSIKTTKTRFFNINNKIFLLYRIIKSAVYHLGLANQTFISGMVNVLNEFSLLETAPKVPVVYYP